MCLAPLLAVWKAAGVGRERLGRVATADVKEFISVLLRLIALEEAREGGMVSGGAGGDSAYRKFVVAVTFSSPTQSH